MMKRICSFAYACAAIAVAACDNAGADLGVPDDATFQGRVVVGVFLDRDASGGASPGDTVVSGVRVALLLPGGRDTIKVVTTDSLGVAVFDSVDIGSYRVAVDRGSVGDSIATVVGDSGTIRIVARNDSIIATRAVRLAFAEVSIAEARALPAGRRVFVRGIVTAPFQFFRDSSSYITDGTSNIRITGARHRPGRAGNNIGDSVLVLATTGTRTGQPVLLDGLIGTYAEKPAPTATVVTVAEARTARNGALDAALVDVTNARIVDTLTVDTDFIIRIADAADSTVITEVSIGALLNPPRPAFQKGFVISVRGVLSPVAGGTWQVRLRNGTDLLNLAPPPGALLGVRRQASGVRR